MDNAIAVLSAIGAALFWGVPQAVSKLGLARMDLVTYAAIRAAFALLFIIPYGLLTKGFSYADPVLIGMAAFAGFIDSFLGTMLYMYALKRGEAHGAATLANTAPFWGVVTAVLCLGEPSRASLLLAGALVPVGAYLLIFPGEKVGNHPPVSARLAALGAALLWGVAETGPAKYCLDRGMSPIEFQLILVGAAALSWWAVALLPSPRRNRHITRSGLGIALFTAVTGFFLGWLLWLYGLQFSRASVLSPIRGGMMTLFAFLTSLLLLRERPARRSWIGAALACAGVVLASTTM